MNRLVGKKGTIDIITSGKRKMLHIVEANGNIIIAPLKDLDIFIKKLEIYSTEDGGMSLGNWTE